MNDLNDLINPLQQSNDAYNDLVALLATQELTNLKKIKTVSRIKPEQVAILTKLELFASTFKINFTKKIAREILELQISINGLGRKELVQLVNQRENDLLTNKKAKDIFRWWTDFFSLLVNKAGARLYIWQRY